MLSLKLISKSITFKPHIVADRLSEFPKFKLINLSDKEEVEKIINKFLPYSDFNFFSMWSWNINRQMMVSELNKNLVVLFNDYVSGKPFLSFIGKNKVLETVSILTEFSKNNYHTNELKLICEDVVKLLPKRKFIVTDDRDSYDYIYSVASLANMNNWPGNSLGKYIRRFMKLYPDYVVKRCSIQDIPKKEYMKMYKKWADSKKLENYFGLNEYKAFERFIQLNDKNIGVISLYVNSVMIGFVMHQIISKDYAVSHFAKADVGYKGVYNFLDWEEAKFLNEKRVKYFNYEQDLGIANLRQSKEKYKPTFFLKKFIVSKKP